MDIRPLMLCVLLLPGCSCQRHADEAERNTAGNASTADAALPPSSRHDSAEAGSPRPPPIKGAREAVATVHRYIAALRDPDARALDAFWIGGKAPVVPEDAALHRVEGLRAMRIENDRPIALDTNAPVQTVEVPVRITASTHDGRRRFHGWYRLHRKADGSGWEITAASLQPVID